MKKGSTAGLYRHYLQNLVTAELRAKRVGAVTHSDVVALHRNIGADRPATANRVIVTLQGVYTFAGRNGHVTDRHNPARDIEKFKEEPKDRYLTTDELTRLGHVMRTAVTDGLPWPEKEVANPSKHRRKQENQKTVLDVYVAAAVYLLIFTGCRLGEILNLEWSMVDTERGMLFLPDSKTGKKAVVLNTVAMTILQRLEPIGKYVIPGDPGPNGEDRPRADLKRPWGLIKHHAGLEGVRIHDLRHTHASIGAGDGLGLPIIGKLLGHKNVTTTARYAHLDVDPVRRASNAIGEKLSTAMQIEKAAPD
jgi:integrase